MLNDKKLKILLEDKIEFVNLEDSIDLSLRENINYFTLFNLLKQNILKQLLK